MTKEQIKAGIQFVITILNALCAVICTSSCSNHLNL